MARDVKNNARPRASGKPQSSAWPGIFAGLILGLIIAVAVFYMVSKNPPRFDNLLAQQKTPTASRAPATPQQPEELKPLGEEPGQQQRYDFYKILPGNGEAAPSAPVATPAVPKAPVVETSPIDEQRPAYLQAGSFQQSEEADNLKARLAMLGLEVEIQTVTLGDLGVRHRVRVGPLRSPAEVQQARALLSQNGIEAVMAK